MIRFYIYEIGYKNKGGVVYLFVILKKMIILITMQNINPQYHRQQQKMHKQQASGLPLQELKTQKYELIITPLEITNKLSSPVHRKKIVIKLGQSIASTHQLFVPIQLIAEVLYSNTTNKYCPVKGIIKIFDCVDQMNQIISCVGSFQADQLLHNKLDKQIIVKNIGSTILKLEVIVKPLSQSHVEQPKLSKLCESISVISSQNIGENSESSSKRGQSEENGLQQSGRLAGIRRVNTLNFNHGVNSSDVYDLKSGINLGFSKQMPNGINPKSKLEAKVISLKKFHSKQDRIQHNQKQMEEVKLINTNMDGNSFNKTKLDNFEGNRRQLEKINNQILQLQSKQSNSEDQQNQDTKHLKAPPFFHCFPHNLGLSSSNSQIASRQFLPDQIHSDSIRSISINEDNTQKQTISNMITDSIKISKQPKRHSITVQASKIEDTHSNYKNPLNNSELSNSIASVTSKASSPQLLQQYQLLEIQTLGELLVEERRKNLLYEQKIEKMQLKAIATKQKYMVLLQQWEKWCQFGLDYLQNLYKDEKGHYILDISSQKDRISLKYHINKESEQALLNFMSLTTENCMMYKAEYQERTNMKTQNSELTFGRHRNMTENSQISSPQFEKVIEKIEATYTNNTYLIKKNKEYETHIQHLQTSLSQKQAELSQFKQQNHRLTVLCDELQQQVSYLQSQISSLSGINSYLKQKDTQMQSIISSKQEAIQSLKKKVRQNNNEMDRLEQEMVNCKKIADNKDLMLEQMREQLADKDQMLESYRQVYGEISRNGRNVQLNSQIKSYSSLCVDNLGDD